MEERWFYSKSADGISASMSNFCKLPVPIRDKYGNTYDTVEAYIHAQKFGYLVGGEERPDLRALFTTAGAIGCQSSAAVKRAGGRASFKKLGVALNVKAWESHRRRVMEDAVRLRWAVDAKFRRVVVGCLDRGEELHHFQRGVYYKCKKTGVIVGTDNSLGELLMALGKEELAKANGEEEEEEE